MLSPELEPYMDEQGRFNDWPSRKKRYLQEEILYFLAGKFEIGKEYNEREVNDLLNQYHTFEDWALLRRELFEIGLLNRTKDGSRYWRTNTTFV